MIRKIISILFIIIFCGFIGLLFILGIAAYEYEHGFCQEECGFIGYNHSFYKEFSQMCTCTNGINNQTSFNIKASEKYNSTGKALLKRKFNKIED